MGTLREDSKHTYLLCHDRKTDDELFAIVSNNLAAISYSDYYTAQRLFGEIDACQQILDNRTKKAEAAMEEDYAILEAISNWELSLHERRQNAIFNLPAARSYLGQLVASVLAEEDGLTAEEICKWAEELAALPEATYQQLLKDLASEGILAEKEGKYYLLTTCDETLFPPDPIAWAKRKAEEYNAGKEANKQTTLSENQLRFLALLISNNHPATEYDWFENIERPIITSIKEMKERRRPRAIGELNRLRPMGILQTTSIPGTTCKLYYFKMLGEVDG